MNKPSPDGDWLARQFFSESDLKMAPELYAARHSHRWGGFSLHLHTFADAALGAWVRRLGEILGSEEEIDRCRRHYLDSAELAAVEKKEAEQF
jgi:hypothetical protein